MKTHIKSVLIANRGEIVVRIAKTLKRLGIKVYGLAAEFDPSPFHVKFVDEILELKGSDLTQTYLHKEQIIGLCKEHNIDAIHPGYGFLSENADFAKACEQNKIIFIGPNTQAIEAMGSKARAKDLMQKAKVPVIPGYNGEDQNLQTLQQHALEIGFPVLIKASAGGGGKGMKIVHEKSQLESAISSAKNESLKSFGDDRLIIEKYIEEPRHIEFQIFGDQHGNMVHLGERECSIQRRHQKIIEETPSPFLTDEIRQKMGQAAIACGKTLNYYNAGTVEFIVDKKGSFYFLEVNTRLQVEHPITEFVTGIDLVELQLKVAQGEKLPFSQEQICFRGHALECRVYAEDPQNHFLPDVGKIVFYEEPNGEFLRIDSGVDGESEVTLNFDPMIAKVIVYGETREQSLSRMKNALKNYPILGVKTNQAFLLEVLDHKDFQSGKFSTHFIDQNFPNWEKQITSDEEQILSYIVKNQLYASQAVINLASQNAEQNIWQHLQGFRL